jgi:predicted metal-dependent hydrolase
MKTIEVGNLSIEVEQKDIKNIHLSVYPPNGKVKISAPLKHELNTIRVFAISKLSWIKSQQAKILKQERETQREFLNLENHYYKGERYLLNIIKENSPPKVILRAKTMDVYTRPNSSKEKIQEVIEEWYRGELRKDIPVLIAKWESILNVKVKDFGIKKMKTKWGTCNDKAGRV